MQKANVREEASSSPEYLTFEDICPTWSNKLKADLDMDDLHILTRKPEMCIVGEAWGYTSRYLGYRVVYLIPFIGCWNCIKFGNKIGKTAKQHNKSCKNFLQPIIHDFVYHWNEKHQKITLKKKEEKNIAKLNTITTIAIPISLFYFHSLVFTFGFFNPSDLFIKIMFPSFR